LAFKIVYKRSVERDLSRLDKPTARRILNKIEEELPGKAAAMPALKGSFAGLRKYRVGDHRVIFVLLGDEIQVLRIGARKDVYR
jgi:addiction module RelE/StbE family toxin